MKKNDKEFADAIVALVGIALVFLLSSIFSCRTSSKKQDFRDRDIRTLTEGVLK